MGPANLRPRSGSGQAGRLSLRAAPLSARERRSEHGCLWTGQEDGSGVLYFILTWSKARGQHRLGAALLCFPTICGRRTLFLIEPSAKGGVVDVLHGFGHDLGSACGSGKDSFLNAGTAIGCAFSAVIQAVPAVAHFCCVRKIVTHHCAASLGEESWDGCHHPF